MANGWGGARAGAGRPVEGPPSVNIRVSRSARMLFKVAAQIQDIHINTAINRAARLYFDKVNRPNGSKK